MTSQPTNEGGSEARFREWMKHAHIYDADLACRRTWETQELYWSKRCEAMEKLIKQLTGEQIPPSSIGEPPRDSEVNMPKNEGGSETRHSPQVEGEKEALPDPNQSNAFSRGVYERDCEIDRLKARCEAMEKALKEISDSPLNNPMPETPLLQWIAREALASLKGGDER